MMSRPVGPFRISNICNRSRHHGIKPVLQILTFNSNEQEVDCTNQELVDKDLLIKQGYHPL